MNKKDEKVIRCECGNVICVRSPSDGTITVKRQGRQIEITNAERVTILCEKCQRKNTITGDDKER